MAASSSFLTIQLCLYGFSALFFLVFIYWFFLLWRKTGDGAFVWLAAGIGLMPLLTVISIVVQLILFRLGIIGNSANVTMVVLSSFLTITIKMMAFGFIVMGLRQIAGGCIGIRNLFSFRAPNSIEEGEA